MTNIVFSLGQRKNPKQIIKKLFALYEEVLLEKMGRRSMSNSSRRRREELNDMVATQRPFTPKINKVSEKLDREKRTRQKSQRSYRDRLSVMKSLLTIRQVDSEDEMMSSHKSTNKLREGVLTNQHQDGDISPVKSFLNTYNQPQLKNKKDKKRKPRTKSANTRDNSSQKIHRCE